MGLFSLHNGRVQRNEFGFKSILTSKKILLDIIDGHKKNEWLRPSQCDGGVTLIIFITM